jgi:hypothetical protein
LEFEKKGDSLVITPAANASALSTPAFAGIDPDVSYELAAGTLPLIGLASHLQIKALYAGRIRIKDENSKIRSI